MKDHMVAAVVSKIPAGIWKPALSLNWVIIGTTVIVHRIFATVSNTETDYLALLEWSFQYDPKIRIILFLLLNKVELIVAFSFHFADAKGRENLKWNHCDAICL